MSGDGVIECDGTYACFMANEVSRYASDGSFANILCWGLLSCAYIARLYNERG